MEAAWNSHIRRYMFALFVRYYERHSEYSYAFHMHDTQSIHSCVNDKTQSRIFATNTKKNGNESNVSDSCHFHVHHFTSNLHSATQNEY